MFGDTLTLPSPLAIGTDTLDTIAGGDTTPVTVVDPYVDYTLAVGYGPLGPAPSLATQSTASTQAPQSATTTQIPSALFQQITGTTSPSWLQQLTGTGSTSSSLTQILPIALLGLGILLLMAPKDDSDVQ